MARARRPELKGLPYGQKQAAEESMAAVPMADAGYDQPAPPPRVIPVSYTHLTLPTKA